MKGMLLAIEGISGAGKSTLRNRLLDAARAEGLPLGHMGQFSWLSLPATRTIVRMRSGLRAAGSTEAISAARLDLDLHGRHNLAPALARGHVVADRLTLSTACLLAPVHGLPVADCVRQLAHVPAARAELTVLLTTPAALCLERLSRRATQRRFGEDPDTAARLADLYEHDGVDRGDGAARPAPPLQHRHRPRHADRHVPERLTPNPRAHGAHVGGAPDMHLHPMHPAAWVLDLLGTEGWQVHNLLSFTRASTLALVSRDEAAPVVLKAGFGSNHVLAELDEDIRAAAYGFYWYAEMSPAERALAREDFRHEIAAARTATGAGHVVPLLEEVTTDRFDWCTMPYCPGGSFRSRLTAPRDQKTTAAGLGILADVAAGLNHLHAPAASCTATSTRRTSSSTTGTV